MIQNSNDEYIVTYVSIYGLKVKEYKTDLQSLKKQTKTYNHASTHGVCIIQRLFIVFLST